MDASPLFEAELRRRGLEFLHRADGRYEISVRTRVLLVSLENLSRELRGDEDDVDRVARFTEVVTTAAGSHALAPERLFWSLEPNDFPDSAPFRFAMSQRTDRILADYADDASRLRWVTSKDLDACGLSEQEASERAWSNLDAALRAARIRTETVEGAAVMWLETDFPSKASLILAPCLREIVSPHVGWPVLAVAPDRDFVYLWPASRRELMPHFGRVVVVEYGRAPYPLTTEVFEISETVEAIGAFGSVQ